MNATLRDIAPNAVITEVSLKTLDDITLHGVQLIQPAAQANIVFYGGNGMTISKTHKILEEFAYLPANLIWFDYRGSGLSEKSTHLSIDALKSDALAVVDFAKATLPSDLPLIVHGLSMGSLLATQLANERDIDGLVLDSAISTVPELVDNLVPFWAKPFTSITLDAELQQINNLQPIAHYQHALLVLVGRDDTVTPVSASQAIFNAAVLSPSKALYVIADAEHGMTIKSEQTISLYNKFIATVGHLKQQ